MPFSEPCRSGRGEGDNIVTTELDHPGVFDAAQSFGRQFRKEVRVARLDPDTGRVAAAGVLALIGGQTRLLPRTPPMTRGRW